jgi:hypothetical protein
MKFKVGESVICINDDFKWARRRYPSVTFPVRGKCYVVRAYVVGGRAPGILLQGIVNRNVVYLDGKTREAGFWEERFERAPSIDGIKKAATDISRWLPIEMVEPEKEDA